jgi:hypothetical protein
MTLNSTRISSYGFQLFAVTFGSGGTRMYFRVSENSYERTSTFEKVAVATSNFSALQTRLHFFIGRRAVRQISLKLHP